MVSGLLSSTSKSSSRRQDLDFFFDSVELLKCGQGWLHKNLFPKGHTDNGVTQSTV